jgi:hypothetical protein
VFAGDDVADRFVGSSPAFSSRHAPLLTEHHYRPVPGNPITPWWALPVNALDRATGLLPQLLYERLDESASTSRSCTRASASRVSATPMIRSGKARAAG